MANISVPVFPPDNAMPFLHYYYMNSGMVFPGVLSNECSMYMIWILLLSFLYRIGIDSCTYIHLKWVYSSLFEMILMIWFDITGWINCYFDMNWVNCQ